jgi:HAE1 family hydrophobic/amphiphilic exporter-1
MRVWLDPERLLARGLTPQDVVAAIQEQSQQVTAGQLGAPPAPAGTAFQFTVEVRGRLTEPTQFEDIILRSATGDGGRLTRLSDVGRVELGAQSYGQAFRLDGRPAAGIAIFQTPGANALDVATRVRARLQELSRAFPPGLSVTVPFDTTRFVSAAIDEVWKTLIEAAVLVLLVILVFLQDWRATLVPATTVPVTIIGAFAAMAVLGFTVNLSTLFALVLAIGIVVDDAIVVVEGAAAGIERGLPAPEAARRAMDELFGPILGITLVLVAVFLPAAFLPGLTGQMYAQFALVIAATALLSAINAATLKPTQCALWLRPAVPPERRNAFYRGFNALYGRLERAYARLIGAMARRSLAVAAGGLALVAAGALGLARAPTGFLPIEDQGYMLVAVQLPDGASLERTGAALDRAAAAARAVPGVAETIAIAGLSPLDNNAPLANAGVIYVMLKDWAERGREQGLLPTYQRLTAAMDAIDEASIIVLPPPPIQGIGNAAGFTMQVELRDGSADFTRLQDLARGIAATGATQSGLGRLNAPFRAEVPQFRVEVDRAKAEALQVSVGDVFAALSTALGSSYATQVTLFGRTFQVYAQAEGTSRTRPEDIAAIRVRAAGGAMVPIGTLASVAPTAGPALIGLYNLYPTAAVIGVPAQGTSSGEALSLMEQIAARILGPGSAFEWTALSFQEKAVGSQVLLAFGLAVLLVYLVLAGQYESWIAPLSVVAAVPLALIGPALALAAVGLANNLYVQIGLVLLIALSAKNAILIVEVARERRLHGEAIETAAVEAARRRLRPILMTSFAFILGVVPLVLATGAGASARASLGIAVFTGMLASTCLAVLFVPAFFVVLQRLEERLARRRPAAAAREA